MALADICGFRPTGKFLDTSDHCSESANIESNSQLMLPPFPQPSLNLGNALVDDSGREIPMNFDHGTTTLGFKYKGGVVLAVDSRATGGMYIGSGSVRKIIEINKFLLGTIFFF